MALVTVAQIRAFLKQPNIAEVTDELTLLYGMALADIETALGRAIVGTGRTFGTPQGWAVVQSLRGPSDGGTTTTTGSARAALSTLDDYAGRYEALASSWILDTVAARWKQRFPNVTSESGTGGSVSYGSGRIPSDVAQSIRMVSREIQGR